MSSIVPSSEANVIEFRMKLSGPTLTRFMSVALSLLLGSGLFGLIHAKADSSPADVPSATVSRDVLDE